jgi:hypothetical protein
MGKGAGCSAEHDDLSDEVEGGAMILRTSAATKPSV